MIIKRRSFLKAASCLPLSLSIPSLVHSEINLGRTKITTVSDGSITLPASLTFDTMPKNELDLIINEFSLSKDQLVRECNVTLVETEDRKILFDVGAGLYFLDGMGVILDSLDEQGLAPEDITDVIFTHAHPDHIWGVLDDFDDLLFPEAMYHIGRVEWDYWWNPETVNEVDESRVQTAVGAKTRFEALQDQIEFFDDGDEPIPGVLALMTPGHTPGHMSFEIANGSQSALIVGDALNNHHVAFKKPNWLSGLDQDPEMAALTRQKLLNRSSSEDMLLIGFHLPEGGIGRVVQSGKEYSFVNI
jgi:glyoxylase-like metal-dependent hydrolase (beta-lactamase superfamily II)